MTYAPLDPGALYAGLAGDATAYQTLAANADEIYATYAPPIVIYSRTISIGAGVTAQRLLVWMLERNQDLLTMRVRVRATGTGGSSTVTVICGGASTSQSVSGASAWYNVDVVPGSRGPATCELQVTTGGGITIDIERVEAYLLPAAPAASPLGSGFKRTASGSGIFTGNRAVASEHASRWLAQMIRIARDRPVLCTQHMTRTTTTGAKSVGDWQASNSTSLALVGRLRLPRVDTTNRQYVLSAFTLESAGGGIAIVSVGNENWNLTDLGGTTGKWSRTSMRLGPGPHNIRAMIYSGGSNTARFCYFSIHREALSVDGS